MRAVAGERRASRVRERGRGEEGERGREKKRKREKEKEKWRKRKERKRERWRKSRRRLRPDTHARRLGMTRGTRANRETGQRWIRMLGPVYREIGRERSELNDEKVLRIIFSACFILVDFSGCHTQQTVN